MNDYGRNLIKITKTKEEADFEHEHPYMVGVCPECNEKLPVISVQYPSKIKKVFNKRCITIKSEERDDFWTEFCWDMLSYYYKHIYVDKYRCGCCGAEWISGRYKCKSEENTESISIAKMNI